MKLFILWLSLVNLAFAKTTPEEILQRADEIRNPSQSFFMQVEVLSGSDLSLFEVLSKRQR
ncbi:MAG: hypothetical protein U0T83_07375 [Bacteriovoracaceae bacterium]